MMFIEQCCKLQNGCTTAEILSLAGPSWQGTGLALYLAGTATECSTILDPVYAKHITHHSLNCPHIQSDHSLCATLSNSRRTREKPTMQNGEHKTLISGTAWFLFELRLAAISYYTLKPNGSISEESQFYLETSHNFFDRSACLPRSLVNNSTYWPSDRPSTSTTACREHFVYTRQDTRQSSQWSTTYESALWAWQGARRCAFYVLLTIIYCTLYWG